MQSLLKRARSALLLVALLVLSGCYLPASFDAELELSRTGLYKMSFDGFIVETGLYNEIRLNKIDQEKIQEKIATILRDFKRDSSTKSVSHFGKGAFKVNWVKSGDIIRSRQVMCFRRNENMLSISFNKNTGRIGLAGRYIQKKDGDRIQAMGLDVKGVIRIKTDAKVLSHNAQKTFKEGAVTVYFWELKSVYDRAPKMEVVLRSPPLFPRQAPDQAGGVPAPTAHGLNFPVELIHQCSHRQSRFVFASFRQGDTQILAHPIDREAEIKFIIDHGVAPVGHLPRARRALGNHIDHPFAIKPGADCEIQPFR